MMVCKKCGTVNRPENRYCVKCGAALQDSFKLLAVLLIIVGMLIGTVFAYFFISNVKSDKAVHTTGVFSGGSGGGGPYSANTVSTNLPQITAAPTASPAASPTAAPTSTPAPPTLTPAPQASAVPRATENGGIESVLSVPYYTMYVNDEFGFSCIYPMNFQAYNDPDVLYSVQSPQGTARELIDVRSASGKTPQEELNRYISSHSGRVQTKRAEDDYYVISVDNGEKCYYKYCKFQHGYMYSFEFINPSIQDEIYSRYVEDIYEEFTID